MVWLKRLVILIVICVAIVIGSLMLIPSERVAQMAAERVEAQTGRTLQIGGEVKPTLWPTLGVRVGDVRLSNPSFMAAELNDTPMIIAERLSVGVDLLSLLSGDLKLRELTLVRPDIRLHRDAQGRANWDFGDTQSVNDGGSGLPSGATLDVLSVQNGRFSYVDVPAQIAQSVSAVDLTLRYPEADAPLTVQASMLYNTAAVSLDASVSELKDMLAGRLSPISATVVVGGSNVTLEGAASTAPAFQGKLLMNARDRKQLYQVLGMEALELPEGLGRDSIALTSDLTLTAENSAHLRNLVLELDRNTLTGAVDVTTAGARPRVVANIAATTLDLAGLSASGGQGAVPAPEGGWSKDPIDLSVLREVDAGIALETGAIELGDARIEGLELRTALDAGRAVSTINRMDLYGGQITGEVIVNARSGLSSRINLALKDLQAQALLAEFFDFQHLTGTAQGQMNVLLVGNSLDALMRSLDGTADFSIGQGALTGIDLAGMLRNLDASYAGGSARTIFNSLSGTFTFQEGVMQNDDLALVAPSLTANGAGKVNFGVQTVDYRIEPVVLRDEASGIRVPVLIDGPWSDLRYRPDLQSLIDQELEAEKAALKAKAAAAERAAKQKAEAAVQAAEAAARAKVAAELDLAPEELTSTDAAKDAAKKKLADELQNALGGLLGGN